MELDQVKPLSSDFKKESHNHLSWSAYRLNRVHIQSNDKEKKRKDTLRYLRENDLLLFKDDKGNTNVVCHREQDVERMNNILRDNTRLLKAGDVDWNDCDTHTQ